MTKQQKQAALDIISKQIAHCKICQKDKVGMPVPGEGNPNARIVFIGEAPGKEEAKIGRPFIGRSGKLLRQLILTTGITESEVFITSAVKYLPKYITPTLADIAHGRVHLAKQLAVITPKFVVLLGKTATIALLGYSPEVAKVHGTVVRHKGIGYFITYHPAAPLYAPKLKLGILRDFKKLKRLLAA